MKRLATLLVLGIVTSVSAETARITYSPALGTKTRYRMEMTSSAKVLDLQMNAGNAAQRDQFKKTLESATSTKTVMDNLETVQKVEADGTRVVASEMTMTVSTPAAPSGFKAAFNVQSVYKADGSVEIKSFKLDKTKTSKDLAAAFEGQTGSFQNLFKQSANFGFYGKTISDKPLEVTLEVPAPSSAANLNLKYKMRATYRLTGRTAKGGYTIAYTTRLEPVNANTKQNGLDLNIQFEGKEAQGEIQVLPDGRIERLTQPMTMLMNSQISGKGQQMSYKMQVQTQTVMNMLP